MSISHSLIDITYSCKSVLVYSVLVPETAKDAMYGNFQITLAYDS